MLESKETVIKQTRAVLQHEAHIDLQKHSVHINFSDGVLTLEGEVPTIKSKAMAVVAADKVIGVREVIDRLQVIPEQQLDDEAIRDTVCDHLLDDVDFKNCGLYTLLKGDVTIYREAPVDDSSGAIVMTIDRGVITLAGQVISLTHKRLAGVLVWWARGCRDVINSLEVIPPEEDNDEEVVDALRLVFEIDPVIPAEQITIQVKNYIVTLTGIVPTEEAKKRAESDAWYLFSVKDVVNLLEVGS